MYQLASLRATCWLPDIGLANVIETSRTSLLKISREWDDWNHWNLFSIIADLRNSSLTLTNITMILAREDKYSQLGKLTVYRTCIFHFWFLSWTHRRLFRMWLLCEMVVIWAITVTGIDVFLLPDRTELS